MQGNRVYGRAFFIGNLLFCLISFQCSTQHPLDTILATSDPKIQQIINKVEDHQVQIVYTQVEPQEGQAPLLKRWTYGVDEQRYFYPASTAKLPIVLLALEKINGLKKQGVNVDIHTPFQVFNPLTGETIQEKDTTHPQGHLTLEHLIKKIFLVSDNDAYNLLFDFLGKDYINEQLASKGLQNTQIHHKFLFGADNTNTWEYLFGNSTDTIYFQKSLHAKFEKNNSTLKDVLRGKGFMQEGQLVAQPMDFSLKNRISILDLEGILMRVLLPEKFSPEQQFQLTDEDYAFVRYWMSRNTLESTAPDYSKDPTFYDSYVKFLVFGDTPGKMDGTIRIFNKVGDAYGTLTDTAYISVPEENIAFFLTATVFVNANGIFNDDVYEYDTLGMPFLGALGRAVLNYERSRN